MHSFVRGIKVAVPYTNCTWIARVDSRPQAAFILGGNDDRRCPFGRSCLEDNVLQHLSNSSLSKCLFWGPAG